ncbi:hypothetical protein LXL04_036637 [Taraxacum kok-saghyz]
MGRIPCCEKESVKKGQWTTSCLPTSLNMGLVIGDSFPKMQASKDVGRAAGCAGLTTEEQIIVRLHSVLGNRIILDVKSLSMTVLKRYVLRLFMSLKYITANIVDRNNGRIVATASTVEQSIKTSLECGRACNAKAAMVVGEVLAMRLKVEGLESGQERGIHVDVKKELEKKDFKNRTKVWAVINSLKNNGVKLILDVDNDTSKPC